MDLSIIIPAFNESRKIEKDILSASEFIQSNFEHGEIIVVDDGSEDNTADVVFQCQDKVNIEVHLLKLGMNYGKGTSVKNGVNLAKGEIILYADAGLTVPFSDSLIGIDLIKNGVCDIANGSRKMPNSVITKRQDIDRRMISKIFGKAVKLLLKIPRELTDTQCGFKVYTSEAAKAVFSDLEIPGFLFEIEVIILAQLKGFKIKEFPVTWRCDRDSRISIKKSSKSVFDEFVKLFRKYRLS